MSESLDLAFEPLLPLRAPEDGDDLVRHGYRLRIRGGPALADDDSLLRAHGVSVATVLLMDRGLCESEALAPGCRLALSPVYDPDDTEAVELLDREGRLRFGELLHGPVGMIRAGLDHGLELDVRSLAEWRSPDDGERRRLDVVVSPRALVSLEEPPPLIVEPPVVSRVRKALVLVVDGQLEPKWWDPEGRAGPLELSRLPGSEELRSELGRLSEDWQRARSAREEVDSGFEILEAGWAYDEVVADAKRLWLRARRELGRRYRIGFRGPDMDAPVWSPPERDDDIEF